MKKRFTRILAALALLVFMTPSLVAWGQTRTEITWTASEQGYSNQQEISNVTFNENVSAVFSKGTNSNAPKYYTSGTAIRCYGGNYFTISTTSVNMTSIAITFGSSDGSNEITTDVGTYSNGTWTGTATSVKFTIGGTSGNRRIAGFTINYGGTPTPTCEAPVFDPVAGTYTEAQNVTISCATADATIYYTTNGDEPTTNSTVYTAAINVSTNTTIKAMAAAEGYNNSAAATAEYTILEHAGTLEDPYTVADARAAIEGLGTISNAYVAGIVCQVDSYNSNYSSITYWISDDGTTNNKLEVYSGKGIDGADFSSINDIQVDDIVVVTGTLKKYNSTYEFDYNNELVSLVRPQYPTIDATAGSALAYYATTGNITYEIGNYVAGTMTATTAVDWISNFTYSQEDEMGEVNFSVTPNTGTARTANVTLTYSYGNNQTVTAVVEVSQNGVPSVTVAPDAVTVAAAGDYPEFAISFESLVITSASNFDVTFFDATGTTPTTQPDWITDYDISAETTGYVLTLEVDENTGSQRVAYLKVYALDDNEIEKYSNLVTITQSAPANTTIDLRGTTTAVSFTPGNYSSLTNSYGDYSNVTYTGSNNVEYSGWSLHQVLKSSGNLQMKKEGAGYVEMPTILTDYGFAIAVTAVTNSVEIVLDEESGTNTLTTAETSADVVIQTGSSYAVISTITITPLSAPAEYTLTVSNLSHVNLYTFETGDDSDMLIENEGSVDIYNGTQVFFSVDVHSGYILQSLVVDGNDVTDQIEDGDVYFYTMPDHDVTVTATAVLAPATDDYELFSGELVEGDYIIYYNGYAMKNTAVAVGTNRLAYEIVTPSSSDIISTYDASIVWHIAPSDDYWTIYNAAENKYAASTGTKNQAQMLADGTDNKSLWTVSGSSTYEFVNKYNSSNSVNSNLRNNGTNGWACYSTSTGGALSLYKKVEPYTKDIVGNTWYFISSPTGTAPTNLDDLSDLYYYDEQDHYWRNKEVAANANGFDFGYGKGYLCANADPTLQTTPETVSLSFTGDLLTGDTYNVPVTYNATTSEGDNNLLAGWNLVGNPFNSNATLNMDCYTISGNAINMTAYTAGSYTVAPCTGVMVKATGANQNVIFTKSSQASQLKQLEMTVAQQVMSRGTATSMVHDNAIVNFNAGSQLEKFPFNADAAELYIPQDGKDYAIVSSEAQGEMPVNFKAKENGTYTLSINPEGVEMNYLHLIDNKTGNDVDLLQTPSYSFEAKVNDYESRFRLVFAANNEDGVSTGSAAFAFYSNGSWIINNAGEATLQVVDLTGRILSSETVNGSVSKTINAVPGVYMLCLINGDNVNVQKIVVR